jgi:hypothetical protein
VIYRTLAALAPGACRSAVKCWLLVRQHIVACMGRKTKHRSLRVFSEYVQVLKVTVDAAHLSGSSKAMRDAVIAALGERCQPGISQIG